MSLLLSSISAVFAFSWTEDFEGTPSPYWLTHSGNGGTASIVDDGAGNHVLSLASGLSGFALAGVGVQAFSDLDDTQEVPSHKAAAIATTFTGAVFNGAEYWYNNTDGKLFDLPLNEWVALRYAFVPNGGSTHRIWLNGNYVGEYACWRVPEYPSGLAFLLAVGDEDHPGTAWGAAMWDDFSVTGATVPEPGPMAALCVGLASTLVRLRRRI